MRKLKVGLLGALILTAVGSTAFFMGTSVSNARPEVVIEKDHWRHHDGHWCYWSEGDKRWYYTDGNHWFFEDGGKWNVYRFDRKFGKEGFVHADYKAPGENVKIVIPTHKVFRR